MKIIRNCILLVAIAGIPVVQAGELRAPDRVKTGILPSGGLYSIYSVECGLEVESTIARLRDSRQWCVGMRTGAENSLDCFKRASEASSVACEDALIEVAANESETRQR